MNQTQTRKRIRGAGVTALLLVFCMLSFSGCDKKSPKVEAHLTYDSTSDVLLDEERGIAYAFASVSYEPAYVGDAYADWESTVLYQVKGFSPKQLLTEEWTGVGGLLYNRENPLPSLEEMNPDEIYVCTSGMATSCILTIDDAKVVSDAVYYLQNGENVPLPEDGEMTLSMKFLSDDYEGIYYNVLYIERGEGEARQVFLYDRGEKKCAEIPYAVFDGWMYGGDDELAGELSTGETLSEGGELVMSFD